MMIIYHRNEDQSAFSTGWELKTSNMMTMAIVTLWIVSWHPLRWIFLSKYWLPCFSFPHHVFCLINLLYAFSEVSWAAFGSLFFSLKWIDQITEDDIKIILTIALSFFVLLHIIFDGLFLYQGKNLQPSLNPNIIISDVSSSIDKYFC
jgi:hypothetical protein